MSLKECEALIDEYADIANDDTLERKERWSQLRPMIDTLFSCVIYDGQNKYLNRGRIQYWSIYADYVLEEYESAIRQTKAFERYWYSTEHNHPRERLSKILYMGFLASLALGDDESRIYLIERATEESEDSDPDHVAMFYYGLIRTATAQLRFNYATVTGRAALSTLPEIGASTSEIDRIRAGLCSNAIYDLIHENQRDGTTLEDIRGTRELLLETRSLFLDRYPGRVAVLNAQLAVVQAIEGDALNALHAARSSIQEAHDSGEEWTVGVTHLLAARVAILANRGDEAIELLEGIESRTTLHTTQIMLAEAEELRGRAHAFNQRFTQAALSLWNLYRMNEPNKVRRMSMVSQAAIGTPSLLPWGIGSGVVLLISLSLLVLGVVRGPRYIRRIAPWFPAPAPTGDGDSAPSGSVPPGSTQSASRSDAGDGAVSTDRILHLTPHTPAFPDLIDEPTRHVLEQDPTSARALHLLNVTTGDAEHLLDHVALTMPHEGAIPPAVRLTLQPGACEPIRVDRDGPHAVAHYRCELTDKSFSIPGNKPYPAVVFTMANGTPESDEDASPEPHALVLHPEILNGGPDAVLRAVALLGASRMLDGLDGLRDGIAVDSALWNADLLDAHWPRIPDWTET